MQVLKKLLTNDPWRQSPRPRQVSDLRKYCKIIVSTGGLEPPCPFGRQPLKLVRLPISPRRRGPVREQ